MTNRGIKEIYNQIIDEEIGKYYINLNKNDNNIIIEIPLFQVLAKDINLSLFYNHQKRNINNDFGKGFRLNYYNKLDGDINYYTREKCDFTLNVGSNNPTYLIGENEILYPSISNNELHLLTKDYNNNSMYNTIDKKYPDYIKSNKDEYIYFTQNNNKLTSVTNQKGDSVTFDYNDNQTPTDYVHKISFFHTNDNNQTRTIGHININYDSNNRIIKVEYKNSNNYITSEINIEYNTNNVTFILKEENVIKKEFIYTFDSNNKITNINNYYGELVTFTYSSTHNETTVTKNNKSVTYHFSDNNILNYIKDDKENISYYEYDNYKRLIYNLKNINLDVDNVDSVSGNSINYSTDSTKIYQIILLSSNDGYNTSTVTINNNLYTFKGLMVNQIYNPSSISITTSSIGYIYIYVNKDYESISYETDKPYVSEIKTLFSTTTYEYDTYGNLETETTEIIDNGESKTTIKTYTYDNYKVTSYEKKFNNSTKEKISYTYNTNNTIDEIKNLLINPTYNKEEYVYYNNDQYVLNKIKTKFSQTTYTYDLEYKEIEKGIKYVGDSQNTYTISKTYDNYNRIIDTEEQFINNTINQINHYNNSYITYSKIESQYPYSDTSSKQYDFTYDSKGRINQINYYNDTLKEATYRLDGRIDTINNYNKIHKYNYTNNLLTSVSLYNNNQYNNILTFQYDNKERLIEIDDIILNKYKLFNYDNNDKIISYYDSLYQLNVINKYQDNGIYDNRIEKRLSKTIHYKYDYKSSDEKHVWISDNTKNTCNYNYDYIRLYEKNKISDNGISPTVYSNEYVEHNHILYNTTGNLEYRFNINDYGTIYFEYYLGNTNNQTIFRMVDNYYKEIIISIKNGYYYFKAPNHTEVNTNIQASTKHHKILLVLDCEYVEDGEDEYKYNIYNLIIDNYTNLKTYTYDGIEYYNLRSIFYKPISYIAYRDYSILVSSNTFNELESSIYKYEIYVCEAVGVISSVKICKNNGEYHYIKNYGTDEYDRIVSIDHSLTSGSHMMVCEYDNHNNISKITFDFTVGVSSPTDIYEYDELNRVISEKKNGVTTYTYAYYNNGDIKRITRKENNNVSHNFIYYYSNGKLSYIEESYNNTYVDTHYVSYNNDYFISSYDNDNYSYTNNLMTGYSNYDYDYTYEYNSNGLRIKKNKIINNNIVETTEFIYDENNNLIREKIGNNYIYYLYIDNEVVGFIYNNIRYHYIKDMTGRICNIINNSNIIVTYRYSAYGEVEITGDTTIANINHIIYKSYYYDFESGLYYLKSRYYNPSLGIFIQPDKCDYLEFDNINGYNLYTYCNNNPVMYSDPEGHSVLLTLLIAVGVGAAIGGSIAVGKEIKQNGFDITEWDWRSIGANALKGAALNLALVSGGLVGVGAVSGISALGLFASTSLLSFGAGVGAYAINHYKNGFSKSDMIKSGFSTMIHGMINFGIGFSFGISGHWQTLNSNNYSATMDFFKKEQLMNQSTAFFNTIRFYLSNYFKDTLSKMIGNYLLTLLLE